MPYIIKHHAQNLYFAGGPHWTNDKDRAFIIENKRDLPTCIVLQNNYGQLLLFLERVHNFCKNEVYTESRIVQAIVTNMETL